jgi:hypothetical protein
MNAPDSHKIGSISIQGILLFMTNLKWNICMLVLILFITCTLADVYFFFCRLHWRSVLRFSQLQLKKMVSLGGLIKVSNFWSAPSFSLANFPVYPFSAGTP